MHLLPITDAKEIVCQSKVMEIAYGIGNTTIHHPFRITQSRYCFNNIIYPKSVIRLLCANKLSFCHLPFRFSVAMEPHCALKT